MPKRRTSSPHESEQSPERVTRKSVERDWLNVKEACDYLQVSRQTLYNLMSRGLVPYAEVIGVRGRRIKKEDLDKLLREGRGSSR
jgi:excisionase family DNA binding protein